MNYKWINQNLVGFFEKPVCTYYKVFIYKPANMWCTNPQKLSWLGLNNSGGYITDITRMALRPKLDQETVIVSKIVLSSEDHNAITWSTSEIEYEILIDKKEFSSGAMKRAYKVTYFLNKLFTC